MRTVSPSASIRLTRNVRAASAAPPYWEVPDIEAAIRQLEHRGAVMHRGPITTDFGARAAILLDPFGCTIGLNQGSARSRALIRGD